MCVSTQSGVEKLPNLRVLYASNNKLSGWGDLEAAKQLPKLEELLLAGNPIYNDYKDKGALSEYRIEVPPPSLLSPGIQGLTLECRVRYRSDDSVLIAVVLPALDHLWYA